LEVVLLNYQKNLNKKYRNNLRNIVFHFLLKKPHPSPLLEEREKNKKNILPTPLRRGVGGEVVI
jgi:hypothetical protein